MLFMVGYVPKYATGLAAITTHIQTLPAVFFDLFVRSKFIFKLIFLVFSISVIFLYSSYFNRFVLQQGAVYLENFSGKVRIAAIPYLLIYIFVLRNYVHTGLRGLKPIIWFGLLVNIVFIFNSHIAGRLTKGIEPLLLGLLLLIIYSKRSNKFFEDNFLIVQLPGLVFAILVLVFL